MAEEKRKTMPGEKPPKKPPSFEEALSGLEDAVEALKGEGTTLDAAMKNFEEGVNCYRICQKILDEAKQKIEVYGKEVEQ